MYGPIFISLIGPPPLIPHPLIPIAYFRIPFVYLIAILNVMGPKPKSLYPLPTPLYLKLSLAWWEPAYFHSSRPATGSLGCPSKTDPWPFPDLQHRLSGPGRNYSVSALLHWLPRSSPLVLHSVKQESIRSVFLKHSNKSQWKDCGSQDQPSSLLWFHLRLLPLLAIWLKSHWPVPGS